MANRVRIVKRDGRARVFVDGVEIQQLSGYLVNGRRVHLTFTADVELVEETADRRPKVERIALGVG